MKNILVPGLRLEAANQRIINQRHFFKRATRL